MLNKTTLTEMANAVKHFQYMSGQLHKSAHLLGLPTPTQANLRHKLLEEENNELYTAYINNDPVEILDALADQLYVLLGTINQYGMHHLINDAFWEVHKSNMTKVGKTNMPYSTNGVKLQKGPNYVAPDLETLFVVGNVKKIITLLNVYFCDIIDTVVVEKRIKNINEYINNQLQTYRMFHAIYVSITHHNINIEKFKEIMHEANIQLLYKRIIVDYDEATSRCYEFYPYTTLDVLINYQQHINQIIAGVNNVR